jgi:MOSC domain-containing protein YiiM
VTTASVVSVSVGRIVPVDWANRLDRTAIDKRPVDGPVKLAALGFEGDEQADRRVHGGAEQAVYAYAREDIDWWAARLGRGLRNGQFGENLTTTGIDVNGAAVGERWRIGDHVVVEVTKPRYPCRTFQNFLGERAWVRRFTEQARPGAYLRVVETGPVEAGDAITVEHRPGDAPTIAEVFRAAMGLPS